MESLDQIAIKMGTDKSSRVHFYTQHYEPYFSMIRDKELKILEIGVQSGASLRMWKEYFPHAQIFGLDYYDCAPFQEDRITIIQGHQAAPETLEKVSKLGALDVIIDDGSHKNKDTLDCFEYLFPRLAPGGLYIIEDVSAMYWGKTHNVGPPIVIDRLKKLVDEVMSSGKSGIADHLKDQQDGQYALMGDGKMTWWERHVRFVHLYRSIAFIAKHDIHD